MPRIPIPPPLEIVAALEEPAEKPEQCTPLSHNAKLVSQLMVDGRVERAQTRVRMAVNHEFNRKFSQHREETKRQVMEMRNRMSSLRRDVNDTEAAVSFRVQQLERCFEDVRIVLNDDPRIGVRIQRLERGFRMLARSHNQLEKFTRTKFAQLQEEYPLPRPSAEGFTHVRSHQRRVRRHSWVEGQTFLTDHGFMPSPAAVAAGPSIDQLLEEMAAQGGHDAHVDGYETEEMLDNLD